MLISHINFIAGANKPKHKGKIEAGSDSSNSSRILTQHMQNIVEKLLSKQTRESTARNYLSIWREFNKFIVKLDVIPKFWEDRATLFIAHLVDRGVQSMTIRSYISGIKNLLICDKYKWDDSKILLTSLTRECKLVNDRVSTHLPIQCGLLELILFEIQRKFSRNNQIYLEVLYKAMFALGYYGLLRISELAYSKHAI